MATGACREPAVRESVYVVSGDASREAITSSLRALLRTRHHAIPRHRFTMLDTFDGRVRQAGARLTRTDTDGVSVIAWQPRDGRAPLTASVTEPVSFAWDLPDGPLQAALSPVIGVRRLLPKADAEEQGLELDILDDRHKTVARLRIESGHVRQPMPRSAWQPLPTILMLTGLRGYDEAYERLKPIIASRPGISSCPDGLEGVIFRHAGVPNAREELSLRIDVAPGVPAEAGARGIHRAILGILIANEPGLRANIDTEFLHDFRVALRRTRSLLRQLKHVFPSDSVEHFSTEFPGSVGSRGRRAIWTSSSSRSGHRRRTCRLGTWTRSSRFSARLRRTSARRLSRRWTARATRHYSRPGSGFWRSQRHSPRLRPMPHVSLPRWWPAARGG